MEEKAIALFTRFTNVSILYRASDGEYFVEEDDAQKHVTSLGSGAYTTVNRIDPLPPVEEPDPNTPVWVLINEPLSLNKSLGFDGCISFSSHPLVTEGEEVHLVNRTGAFSVGNFVIVKARTAPFRAKYGQITAISQNLITVNIKKVYGEETTPITSWEMILTGEMITSYEIALEQGYNGTAADWVNDAINGYQKAEAARDISITKAAEATAAAVGLAAAVNSANAARDISITKATEATAAAVGLQEAVETSQENAAQSASSAGISTTKAAESTTNAAAAVAAKIAAESYLSGLTAVNGDLGAYNAATNTPALTATPSGSITNGRYYTVTVAGTVGFAGNNFASGATLQVGDKLLKLSTQWYLESNRPVGSVIAGDGRAVSGDEVYKHTKMTRYTDSTNALFNNPTIAFNPSAKTITLPVTGVLNRGTYQNVATVKTLDLTGVAGGNYELYINAAGDLEVISHTTDTLLKDAFLLARFNWSTTSIVVNYCISNYSIDGVLFKNFVDDTLYKRSYNNIGTRINGTINLNGTAKTVSVNGWLFFIDGKSFYLDLSLSIADLANGNYTIYYNTASNALVRRIHNSAHSEATEIFICAFQWSLTTSVFVVEDTIAINTIVNGTTFKKFLPEEQLPDGQLYFDPSVAFFGNGFINIDNATKTITLNGQILSRLGVLGTVGGSVVLTTNNEFSIYLNTETWALSAIGYNVKRNTKEFCIMRVSNNTTQNITAANVKFSVGDFVIDGLRYNRLGQYKKHAPTIPTLSWCEIGDSITILDNKKEDDGSGTGYLGSGYGRKICEKLGIAYNNHHPRGFNGHTFVSVANIFSKTTPDNVRETLPTGDLFTLFLGTNDWGTQSINLGTKADYLNDTFATAPTSYGAIRRLLDLILGRVGGSVNKSPNPPRVILITPMKRGLFGYKSAGTTTKTHEAPPSQYLDANGEYVETVNSRGFKLSDIVNMIKWVGEYEGIHVIDLHNDAGFIPVRYLNLSPTWEATSEETAPPVYQDVLTDNLHPSNKGYNLLASRLIDEISRVITEIKI